MRDIKVTISTEVYYKRCGCCTEGNYEKYHGTIPGSSWVYSWCEYYRGCYLDIGARDTFYIAGDNMQILLFPLDAEELDDMDLQEYVFVGNKI